MVNNSLKSENYEIFLLHQFIMNEGLAIIAILSDERHLAF